MSGTIPTPPVTRPVYDGNGQRVDITISKDQAAPTKTIEANGVQIIVPEGNKGGASLEHSK